MLLQDARGGASGGEHVAPPNGTEKNQTYKDEGPLTGSGSFGGHHLIARIERGPHRMPWEARAFDADRNCRTPAIASSVTS